MFAGAIYVCVSIAQSIEDSGAIIGIECLHKLRNFCSKIEIEKSLCSAHWPTTVSFLDNSIFIEIVIRSTPEARDCAEN